MREKYLNKNPGKAQKAKFELPFLNTENVKNIRIKTHL